jgi:hypothetical protein
MDFYGLPKFNTIKKAKERSAVASASRDGKELSLSSAFVRNPSKLYEQLDKFYKKFKYRYRAVYDETDFVRATIDHELGHVIANRFGISRGELDRAFSKDLRNKLGYYATTNPDEYWAECIAAYFGPLREEMTQIEVQLVENYFKEKGFKIIKM